jgi:predicted ATPase
VEQAGRGLEFYEGPRRSNVQTPDGQDLGVACHTWAALALWFLGYPEQASDRMRTALDLAEIQGQRYTLARVLSKAAIFHQLRRETDLARDYARASLAYATKLGFPYYMGTANILLGWAQVLLGQGEEGFARLHEGLAAYDRTMTEMDRPFFLGLMADAYGSSEQTQEALALLEQALDSIPSGRSFFYEAELYRLKGTLLLQAGPQQDREAAAASFEQALDIARRQQARSLELRSILYLSQPGLAAGEQTGQGLAETVGWFTEGFETPDLQEASERLAALEAR